MSYFPLMLDLQDQNVTVIGGGSIAIKKIRTLLEYNAKITVLSKEFNREFESLEVNKIQTSINNVRDLEPYVKDSRLVIIATDNEKVNDIVEEYCRSLNIMYNRVDHKESPVIFPALLKLKDVTVAVSTSGALPAFSRFLRDQIKNSIEEYITALDVLKNIRSTLPAHNYQKRYLFFEQLFKTHEFWNLIRAEKFEDAEEFAKSLWSKIV